MIFVIWQLGAILWVLSNGNVPIGMLYLIIGNFFAGYADEKQKRIGIILAAIAVILALLRVIGLLRHVN